MKSSIKFENMSFDMKKLKSELELIDKGGWHEHFSGLDKGWKAVPLISLDGKTDSDSNKQGEGSISYLASRYKKTPIASKLPYFNEVIDTFRCLKLRTRIMRLNPGTVIEEHTDTQGWYQGIARMHLPIVTHDEVYFYVDGKRVKLNEGEMWYIDVTRPHKLRNNSNVVRVHLVIDLVINKYVKSIFPKETFYDQSYIFLREYKPAMFSLLRKYKITKAYNKIKAR